MPNISDSDDESYNVAGLSRHKSALNKQSSALRFRVDVILRLSSEAFESLH